MNKLTCNIHKEAGGKTFVNALIFYIATIGG